MQGNLIQSKNTRKSKAVKIVLLMLIVCSLTLLSACSFEGFFEFQGDDNSVNGTVELSNKIDEEIQNGNSEIVLYVENSSEDDIKNITENMGLFWGQPTDYKILKAIADENTIKVKIYLEQNSNYYVVNNYINGEAIPEDQADALAISKELNSAIDDIIKENMSDYEKELAIHDWLVTEIEYGENLDASSKENSSYGAMVSKKTMCRGYAEAMKLFSECVGLKTELIVGTASDSNGDTVGHAWNQVEINDQWYHLDVTHDDPVNDENKNIHYYYFNLNDTDIKKDHQWNSDFFPVCDGDSYMYYKKNDLYYADLDQFRSEVGETFRYDKPKFVEVLVDTKTIYESQIRFIFNAAAIRSFDWATHSSSPVILTITPNYY